MLPSQDCPSTAGLSSADHLLVEHHDQALMCVAKETNQNLTAPARELLLLHQKLARELLLLHQKLGHADMSLVQNLCRRSNPNNASTYKCFRCQRSCTDVCRLPTW